MKKYYRKYNGRFDKKSDPREFWALLSLVGAIFLVSQVYFEKPVVACELNDVICPEEQAPIVEEVKPVVEDKPVVVRDYGNDVANKIYALAVARNFPWPDYLVRLSKCESRWNVNATNDNGRYGIDRGPFQINNYYHPDITDDQAFDLEWSANWTMDMIEKGYQHRWACNKIVKGNFNF